MIDRVFLDRRAVLGSLAGSAALLLGPSCRAQGGGKRLTPEMFGARGDGRTDDYAALAKLAAASSGTNGALVQFGRGKRYRIDRIAIVAGARKNDISDIAFKNSSGLSIDLNGATIDVKGDFHRGADIKRGDHAISYSQAVQPFVFRNCRNLVVRNGSLKGNVDRMTRDEGVVEGGGRGILLYGCAGVLLEDLHIHHFSTDGLQIYPSGAKKVSTDISLRRVTLSNNARQGLSNSGGIRVTAIDSAFSENGFTGGPYRHAPSAGVDLEPNFILDQRSDFRALRCRFDNNRGSPVVAGDPDREALIELIDCSGRCDSSKRIILTAERSLISGGTWHNVEIACAYGAHHAFKHGITVEVTGGLWTGDDPGWAPVFDLSKRNPLVNIHGNRFELRSTQPFTDTYLFRCSNPNHRFADNRIFVSKAGHDGSDIDFIGQFAGATVTGNQWSTDLRAPLKFINNYKGAKQVVGETYSGSFAGARL